MKSSLRAIDLYSGVGGWALGLQMAGIDVVASYEKWGPANETNFKNSRHLAQTVDIRRLNLEDLPKDIDIVVGSPPCTQFSFANRGGNGDIEDGLQDIIKFLSIIDYIKPKLWAMENVPRVAQIIDLELQPGGRLEEFKHLKIKHEVIRMEDFGLPQRRHRCIAGNFDFDLLRSYKTKVSYKTLGQIVRALKTPVEIIDPLYQLTIPKEQLRDHVTEAQLNEEEVRINKASKVNHPVYNSMSFPDSLERSVRTITATCTRVSRESIVISEGQEVYRRLTVRERACLQGFPIVFQFYGSSYSQKLRMVGNAIPPLFSYYVGRALQETKVEALIPVEKLKFDFNQPIPPANDAVPDRPGSTYQETRRFRFAVPSLRLKSGVRFELTNFFESTQAHWRVDFYFGTSKSIQSLNLNKSLFEKVLNSLPNSSKNDIASVLDELSAFIQSADIKNMQRVWCHRGPGTIRPFMLLDKLDEIGDRLKDLLDTISLNAAVLVEDIISTEFGVNDTLPKGLAKLSRNAPLILSGLLAGSLANIELDKHFSMKRLVETRFISNES